MNYYHFEVIRPKNVRNKAGIIAKFAGYVAIAGLTVYETNREVPYLNYISGSVINKLHPDFVPEPTKKYYLFNKALEDIDFLSDYCIDDQWTPVGNTILMETE